MCVAVARLLSMKVLERLIEIWKQPYKKSMLMKIEIIIENKLENSEKC